MFSMRQFNDAMRPRLFAVAGEKREEPEGEGAQGTRSRARRRGSLRARISFGRANITYRTRGRMSVSRHTKKLISHFSARALENFPARSQS